jgi:CheY-like chemotaxis protein
MSAADGLMIERKSRLTILVVEDNHEFGLNALAALPGHDIFLATNLEEAVASLARFKPDFVISDVHFPAELGGKPAENIVPLMHAALEANVPICFVTQADHHGLTERDEGFIAIKPVTISGLTQTLMELTRPNQDTLKAFHTVKSDNSATLKACEKTPEIWARALDMLRNACAKASPLELAIRKVRETVGVRVGVEKGLPILKPPRG